MPRIIDDDLFNNFNSHAHVERDGRRFRCRGYQVYFNSHAHVERDISMAERAISHRHFNSHAHVERDLLHGAETAKENISTHTLTWSVTLDVVYIWCLLNVMRTYFFI